MRHTAVAGHSGAMPNVGRARLHRQPGCKGKYADFDGNIIAIKDMFSLKASRQDQDAKSADMIKKFIQRQIAQEDKRSPLPDQQLCSSLAKTASIYRAVWSRNTERGLASQAPCAENGVSTSAK